MFCSCKHAITEITDCISECMKRTVHISGDLQSSCTIRQLGSGISHSSRSRNQTSACFQINILHKKIKKKLHVNASVFFPKLCLVNAFEECLSD